MIYNIFTRQQPINGGLKRLRTVEAENTSWIIEISVYTTEAIRNLRTEDEVYAVAIVLFLKVGKLTRKNIILDYKFNEW